MYLCLLSRISRVTKKITCYARNSLVHLSQRKLYICSDKVDMTKITWSLDDYWKICIHTILNSQNNSMLRKQNNQDQSYLQNENQNFTYICLKYICTKEYSYSFMGQEACQYWPDRNSMIYMANNFIESFIYLRQCTCKQFTSTSFKLPLLGTFTGILFMIR